MSAHGGPKHHEDLEAWKSAIALAKLVYGLTLRLPRVEHYGLAAQLRDTAVSIPANLAEGAARGSTREFARFVSIAQGSLAEMETHLVLVRELYGIAPDSDVTARVISLRRMLIALRSALIARAQKHS
jgi:carbamoyl-phosphate synthase large subunit